MSNDAFLVNDLSAKAKPLHDLVEERREALAARQSRRKGGFLARNILKQPWASVGLASAVGFAMAAVILGCLPTRLRHGAFLCK